MLKILFFAKLREQIGLAELIIDLKRYAVSNLADVLDLLHNHEEQIGYAAGQFEPLKTALANKSLLASLNHEMFAGEVSLQSAAGVGLSAGDELAFFPPVTGG